MSDPDPILRTEIRDAFKRSRDDALTRFVVKLRRRRAEEIRAVLSGPEPIDLATFNRDVWAIESQTVLRSDGTRLLLVSSDDWDPGVVATEAAVGTDFVSLSDGLLHGAPLRDKDASAN